MFELTKTFLWNFFWKNYRSENRPFLDFFEPFTNAFTTSLFGKTGIFSFFIDKILQRSRMTILKLGKDSPESGEHSRYPESMSGLPSKDFLTNLQKPYFFEKAFFYTCLAYFSLQKKAFSKKYDFWKCVRKSFLGTPDILSGLGIWNVLQTQGYLSPTSEWSYDAPEEFYR